MTATGGQSSEGGKTPARPIARDVVADLLKGTAVVLMIQVHLMEDIAQPKVLEHWVGKTSLFLGGPPAAPLFMLVMGYYTAASARSMGGLLLRGLKLLGLGALLNLGLNAHLLVRIYLGLIPLELIPLGPWPYIFGVDILFVAGSSTMLLALIRPLLKRSALAPLGMALLVVLLTPWMTRILTTDGAARYGFAYVAGEYWWSYFPWFPWMAYPLIGFAWRVGQVANLPRMRQIGNLPHNNWRLVEAGIATACAVGTALTWRYGLAVSNDLSRYYHHDVSYFLWVCAFLFVWIGVHRLGECWFGETAPLRWLKELGRNVTLCYLIQWLLIGNIATALFQSESILHWGLWVVVIVTITTLLARLFVSSSGRPHA
jgi:hypothetical protein